MGTTVIPRRRALGLMAAAAGAALLAACGGGKAATETVRPAPTTIAPIPAGTRTGATDGLQTLVIEAVDFGYKTLGSIAAGPTRVQLKNLGAEPHHAQFMLLNPGVTLNQFGAAFKQGPGAAFPLVAFLGGPGAVNPASQTEVLLDLPAGQYILACFIEGRDHIAHAAKGMTLPFTVAPSAPSVPLPTPAATITLVDFTFEMPATLPAGRNLVRVANKGPQPHEFNLIQLAPGKTLDDVKAFFDPAPGAAPIGPPPGLPIGGMNALTPGKEGIAVLDLAPGQYASICNVPDQSVPNGPSHLHLGMIKGFTVA